MPPVQTALDLYHILSESGTNLRQPVGLETQLLKNSLGSEVGQSMLQLLQVTSSLAKLLNLYPMTLTCDMYMQNRDRHEVKGCLHLMKMQLTITAVQCVQNDRGVAIIFPNLLHPLHICVAALLCRLGSLLDSLYNSSPADCPMLAFAHSPVYAFNTCSSLQSRARQEGVAWDNKSADVQGNVTAPRGSKALVIEGPVCMLADRATEGPHGQSSGLMRHGSVTKQSQQQLFIPSNVTLDVERRLHVSPTTSLPTDSSFPLVLCAAWCF